MEPLAAKSRCWVLERKIALGLQVGVFAGDVEGVKTDAAIGRAWHERLPGWPDGRRQWLQPTAAGGHRRGVRGVGEWSFQCDRAGQRGLAREPLDMGCFQQAANVEVGEIEFGLGCVVAAQRGSAGEVDFSALQLGGRGVGGGTVWIAR
jgi:hypothetical protein